MNVTSQSLLFNVVDSSFNAILQVSVLASETEEGYIKLYNVLGQLSKEFTIQLEPGSNELSLEADDLPPGQYYLHYKTQLTRLFIVLTVVKAMGEPSYKSPF